MSEEKLIEMLDQWFDVTRTLTKEDWMHFKKRVQKGDYEFHSEPNVKW
jgi:extradiol dioxygenase family protein